VQHTGFRSPSEEVHVHLGIEGRVAFVAGGTSGLGLATGRALAAEGASVALASRRLALGASEAARFARGIGVAMDVTDAASIAAAIETTTAAFGPIDILVLNGGGPPAANATGLRVEAVRAAAELLLFGAIELVGHVLPGMRERGWGRILAIGSTAVPQPNPSLVTSSMFRAALVSYLKVLAGEVASEGVTVNVLHPGRIATDRTLALDAARAEATGSTLEVARAESEATIPFGRYGTPEEFGDVATFLCGDTARYITGEQIRVDGGLIRTL
jgi:3-oxoacyl-[acyl-carrier protein] reductase